MEFVLVLVTIGLIMVTLPNGRNIYKVLVNGRQSIYYNFYKVMKVLLDYLRPMTTNPIHKASLII